MVLKCRKYLSRYWNNTTAEGREAMLDADLQADAMEADELCSIRYPIGKRRDACRWQVEDRLFPSRAAR